MKCPICDFSVPSDQLRCPRCSNAITFWKNLDDYAERAFAAGLYELGCGNCAVASQLLLRAAVFAPDRAEYLSTYGRLLGQLEQYEDAAWILRRASELNPNDETTAALDKVVEFLQAQSEAAEDEAETSTESDESPEAEHEAETPAEGGSSSE